MRLFAPDKHLLLTILIRIAYKKDITPRNENKKK